MQVALLVMISSLVNGSLSSWVYRQLELSQPNKLRDRIDFEGGRHYLASLTNMR